jgi:shikimate dehydrogenase
MTDRYAVVGNPIAHSKSPEIHSAFATQTGQDMHYTTLLAPLDAFATTVGQFFAEDGKGLNVTVPFKQQAFQLAASCSQRAERAGAVNTLWRDRNGQLQGDNTDGVGLVRDLLSNHAVTLKDKHLLLLGAGGAVRGVISPLLEQQPASLVIANRTAARAEELAALGAGWGPLQGGGLDALAGKSFDVIINGTSASLQGEVPDIPDDILAPHGVCYDMMYAADATAFVQWGQAHGAGKVMDGLGMLVEQAAESFYIWRKVRPETAPVLEQLRRKMSPAAN